MCVLGLDIGYSNLKMAFGRPGEDPAIMLLPSGAAPASVRHGALHPHASSPDLMVTVGGESYCAALPHDRFDDWVRTLHDNYPETDQYRALFHAALKLTGASKIETLVTGLPSRIAVRKSNREALARRMQGTHLVSQGKQVTVREVHVVPQPVGSFMAYSNLADDSEITLLEEGRVLIVDPGFFSVDWSLISAGELVHSATGSSLHAVSSLLEEACRLQSSEQGDVRLESLENAFRDGKSSVVCGGRLRKLDEIIRKALAVVPPRAMAELRRALRKIGSADLILLTGGGASLYEDAARETFPDTRVVPVPEPATANAFGFWTLGANC